MTLKRIILWFPAVCILLALPYIFSSSSTLLMLNQMGIAIILSLSYNLLLGKAGLLPLGHATYFGFGGFFSVHVILAASNGGLWIPALFIPLFGGLMGLLGAVILGSFTTRRGGLLFAMLSLAMAELVLASSSVFGRFYGGTVDRTELTSLFGFAFQSDRAIYYIIVAWVLLSFLIVLVFTKSPLGRMAEAVGQNSERVEYLGYSQQRLKFFTFCFSGFLAGIAGGLFALSYEFVTVEIISLQQSWQILQMVFIGGIGYFMGPPVGAILLTLMFSGLSGLTDVWNLYIGILFTAMVLFAPYGLTGIAVRIHHRFVIQKEPVPWRLYVCNLTGIVLAGIGIISTLETLYFLKWPIYREKMTLFWIEFIPGTPAPWILFAVLILCGLFFLIHVRKRILLA
jgi:branched-chain amino acid transport system permease protein